MKIQAIQGNAYFSTDFDTVKYMKNCIICVDDKGVISNVYEEGTSDYLTVEKQLKENSSLKVLPEHMVILPGFVDLHNHAPQWPQAGTALDAPLEVWLGKYTFPLEANYRDLSFAKPIYEDIVKTTLKHGTTTAMYFGTVDTDASVLLAQLCGQLGQRGLVGKVVMDDANANPDFYRDETPELAVAETKRFIEQVQALNTSYEQGVYPVITPRFIPSCTDEALTQLGQFVSKYGVHVQTHCSESDWEHNYAIERYGITDAMALDRFGFITNKSILAHAPFLQEDDIKLLVEKGSSIAHCPLSNAYFANSVYPLKDFTKKGLVSGLATDISGGYTPSMYQAIRQSVISSRMLDNGVNPSLPSDVRGRRDSAITLNNAFYTATVAGGVALGLPIGKLEEGYAFDVQIIDTTENIPTLIPEKNEEDLLHKILLLSESVNVNEVYVQGKKVK